MSSRRIGCCSVRSWRYRRSVRGGPHPLSEGEGIRRGDRGTLLLVEFREECGQILRDRIRLLNDEGVAGVWDEDWLGAGGFGEELGVVGGDEDVFFSVEDEHGDVERLETFDGVECQDGLERAEGGDHRGALASLLDGFVEHVRVLVDEVGREEDVHHRCGGLRDGELCPAHHVLHGLRGRGRTGRSSVGRAGDDPTDEPRLQERGAQRDGPAERVTDQDGRTGIERLDQVDGVLGKLVDRVALGRLVGLADAALVVADDSVGV